MGGQFKFIVEHATGSRYLLTAMLTQQSEEMSPSVLYTLKGGVDPSNPDITAYSTLESTRNGWYLYVSGFKSSEKFLRQIKAAFEEFAHIQPLAAGATGIVFASQDSDTIKYFARWTYDEITYYSLESESLSDDDFFAMLQSIRPVDDVLKLADMYYLPAKRTLDLKIGSPLVQHREANRTIKLSALPIISEGSAYLPLRDIASILNMEVNYEPSTGKVHLISRSHGQPSMELNLRTGEVSQADQEKAEVKLLIRNGRTLVPLRFLSERLNSEVEYRPSDKSITISNTYYESGNRIPQHADQPELMLNVFTIAGPPFRYANLAFEETLWGYKSDPLPTGYGTLHYANYQISIELVPGENILEFTDLKTDEMITAAVVNANLTPDQVPFRFSNSPFYDGVKMELKLTTPGSGDEAFDWPAGYAISSSYIDLQGSLSIPWPSLRMTLQKGNQESEPISIPVKNGEFHTRITPPFGSGIYRVMLYNPPNSLPSTESGDVMARIVSFFVNFN